MAGVIRVKCLRPGARLPFRATPDASGYDLFASLEEGEVIVGQRPVFVPTGIAIEAPPGFDVQVRPRSGLARQGVLCTYGTIDSDYRGELMVTMYTVAPEIEHLIRDGDRIAQIVISRLADVGFAEADELSESIRGAGGHGSTGR
ncbi:MAG: dUTP diphosphatase [Dehalococcoidia bacterium]|nr:dUTP diphosphatase [Dehalococcoidia bacterium]